MDAISTEASMIIATLSKRGDARGEVQELVRQAATALGAPIEDGIHNLLLLEEAEVTVVVLKQEGRFLVSQLLDAGWRNETTHAPIESR